MTDSDGFSMLRTLFQARFDALEARITQMYTQFEKENERQDMTIERLADRTTPLGEFNRLSQRVEEAYQKLEAVEEVLAQVQYKVRISWAVGTVLGGILLTLLVAYLQNQVGI